MEKDITKTTVTALFGPFEFTRFCLRQSIAGTIFSMNCIIFFARAYLDDIIIVFEDETYYFRYIRQVIEIVGSVRFRMDAEKCTLGRGSR